MKKKLLGTSGLEITEIGLGTMTWGRQNTEEEGHAQIEYALDQGINFIDTAEMYAVPPTAETYGTTETIIGNWIKKTGRRSDFILASKMSGPGRREWVRDGRPVSPETIREAVEASLQRLQTDFIDLYQFHWPRRAHYNFSGGFEFDPSDGDRQSELDFIAMMIETFGQIIKEGKIGHVGVSNETAWGVSNWVRIAEETGGPRIASIQNEYSLTRRDFDLDLWETCHFENVGLLGYSPLAAGALSGKYMDGVIPPGSRGSLPGGMWRLQEYSEPAFRAYVNLARDHGIDPSQMAIAFALSRPFMSSVLIGATSLDQLKADIAAANVKLDDEVMTGIAKIHRLMPRPL